MGAARAINDNVSFSATLQPVSISEEMQFLLHHIFKLENRECFVAGFSNVKKCMTLDSLIISLHSRINVFMDSYYFNLRLHQEVERVDFQAQIKEKINPNTELSTAKEVGVNESF